MNDLSNYELRKFVAPEFVFGPNARLLAGRYAKNLGARKVLIITDSGILNAGWVTSVCHSLDEQKISFIVFSDVSCNPTAEQVAAGAKLYQEENCNVIIAIGGGSPIDCAKGVAIVSSNQCPILNFIGIDQISHPIPPLICIATTCSGADVSQFAIISDSKQKSKQTIVSKAILPDIALLDPTTLSTQSPYFSACTSFDALSHAMEAFVSNASSPITDLHALEALRLIFPNLKPPCSSNYLLHHYSQIMLGSLYAGMAFSNAILGAIHAMAHSIGGLFNLNHGELIAILLPKVISFNHAVCPERYEKITEVIGLDTRGMNSHAKLCSLTEALTQLTHSLGLPEKLSTLGIKKCDIPLLAKNASQDILLATNPRYPSQRDLEVLYEEAL